MTPDPFKFRNFFPLNLEQKVELAKEEIDSGKRILSVFSSDPKFEYALRYHYQKDFYIFICRKKRIALLHPKSDTKRSLMKLIRLKKKKCTGKEKEIKAQFFQLYEKEYKKCS